MPRISIVIGSVLVLLGLVTWGFAPQLGAPGRSMTALIPSAFGLVLIVLGAVGLNPALRKHTMHAAVAVALLGVIGAVISLFVRRHATSLVGPASQLTMAILCLAFVALGVRSFVAARITNDQ